MAGSEMPRDSSGRSIPCLFTGEVTQKLNIGIAVTASAAMPAGTSSVRLVAQDADAWILIADTSSSHIGATTPAVFMKKDIPEYFGVNGAQKVMVIQDATTGTLHVMPGKSVP